jgi:hypothetical protein
MRFFRGLLYICVVISFSCNRNPRDISDIRPEYKLINLFSQKLQKETGLVLCGYGINIDSKPEKIENGVSDFSVNYKIFKNRQDVISLEDARILISFVTESLLNEINSSNMVRPNLDVFPFTSDNLSVCIYFKDENQIELGKGISCVCLYKGKIRYERYEIEEYRSVYPSIGKHYVIYEETYQNALEIVKGTDSLSLSQ